ncbi:hypothetical protein GLOTRDRAFT_138348 [Gloeophyllum trabeum ATCC 11539]|uniref:Uncharacterized protein n=1 Tax=Gloeophyllum trabeum (strain ATCC 11539 / FP-39264 / Madison 617) TaxID=670483 RepID=S7Q9U3_GLOTA|nr:uncharacterized protein GLOTRDRAFT_138348 [Gloeophyllum trabeum ATCC 11539]EPQ56686.1 hypothetical protein GLOTRDRAFT_138348 [Gloeophyllum trabeum ATCC 11539]
MPMSIPLSFLFLTPKRVPIAVAEHPYVLSEPEVEEEVDALGREWEWGGAGPDDTGRRKAKMRLTWGGLRLKRFTSVPTAAHGSRSKVAETPTSLVLEEDPYEGQDRPKIIPRLTFRLI